MKSTTVCSTHVPDKHIPLFIRPEIQMFNSLESVHHMHPHPHQVSSQLLHLPDLVTRNPLQAQRLTPSLADLSDHPDRPLDHHAVGQADL